MTERIRSRSNHEWVAALRGAEGAETALHELGRYLRGALVRVLRERSGVTEDDLADFVQETLLRLVGHLDSFRGESAFTTWATAVATRVAFTELRRRTARERGREAFDRVVEDARGEPRLQSRAADAIVSRQHVLAALERAVATCLTERQRTAVLAELRGVPTVEIARRMGTNQNALYKLVHDARKKLRGALLRQGFDAQEIRAQIQEGATS